MQNDSLTPISVLAQQALDVQDACNLSGVVHGYSRALTELRKHADAAGRGTDWINRHPIAVLWADKIAHLTGTQFNSDRVSDSYNRVHAMIGGQDGRRS
jgi:hypothetical protein